MSLLPLVAALVPALPAATVQDDFAQRVLQAIAEDDGATLHELAETDLHRLLPLAWDIAREAGFHEAGDERALNAARKLAAAIGDAPGGDLLSAAVRRMPTIDESERVRRRQIEGFIRAGAVEGEESAARWAVSLAAEIGDPFLEARARRVLSDVHRFAGKPEGAFRERELALALATELALDLDVADDQVLLADLDFDAGRLERALGRYDEALAIAERVGDARRTARIESSRGGVLANLGRLRQAGEVLTGALRGHRDLGDRAGEAHALALLAGVQSGRGLYADSIALYREAVELARAAGNREGELRTRVQLAGVYSEIGWTSEAEDELEPLLRSDEIAGMDEAWTTLGLARLDDGRPEDALDPLLTAGGGEARRHLGTAFLLLGRTAEAEESFREAVELGRATQSPLPLAWSLTGLGDALERLGRPAEARDAYEEALAVAADVRSLEGAWRARYGLGRLSEAGGEPDVALDHYLDALEEVEAIRSVLVAPTLRVRYLGDKLELYRRTARLFARRGDLAPAFRWSEAAKARTLLELTAIRPPAELEEVALGGLERNDPLGAALSGLGDPPPLARVQELLGADEALLEYLVGADGVSVFVARSDGTAFVELDTDGAEVAELVGRIHRPFELLRAGRTDVFNLRFDVAAAERLHALLVAPLADRIAGAERVWIVPDGALRRLPFGLLVPEREKRKVDPTRIYAQYEGCRFLIEDFALGYLPTAGLLGPPRRSNEAPGAPLVVADPRPLPDGALPLRAARVEALGFEAWAGGARVLVGEEATEARVKQLAPRAPYLHLATHGALDDRRAAYSRVALAPGGEEDGWLHAYEVERLSLAADVVVLSACETAGVAGRGEGLLGLSRAFLVAGADAVVATSWVLDDEASAFLMDRFGRALAAGEPALSALRTAQLATLREGRRAGLSYVHPFFWAGFMHFG